MSEVHPPIFEPYVGTSSEESKPDPFMATPTYYLETDPFKPPSPFAFPLDSVAVSSTMGSYVSGRGCGHGHGRRDASEG